MMKLGVLLLIVSHVLAAEKTKQDRIVGGEYAEPGEFPYMGSLQYKGYHTCGASIISPRWLLSAAHCMENVIDVTNYTVVVGTTDLKLKPATYAKYNVQRFIPHAYYSAGSIDNDIGLIRTKTSIVMNQNVQTIKMNPNLYGGNVPAVVSGWGKSYYNQVVLPTKLKYTAIPTITNLNCFFQWIPIIISYNKICTATNPVTGVCNGDSGGPLVVNGTQVGIVSFSRMCVGGKPDVYTRTYYYINWIAANVY